MSFEQNMENYNILKTIYTYVKENTLKRRQTSEEDADKTSSLKMAASVITIITALVSALTPTIK